jgi:uncharacterized protein YbjT (DUF2867 family)
MLGSRIAYHLCTHPGARICLLKRGSGAAEKPASIASLLQRGVTVLEGDLTDLGSLDRAMRGIDVIISAVQGRADIVVDGQVALAEAGARNGVRRILPSDFALDFFKATPGDHPGFDARVRAAEQIEATGLECIHVLQGALMELFAPGSPILDYEQGVASFWGDGTQPIEITSLEDTAYMTARVALDRDIASGKFAFAGDRVSVQQATDLAEAYTGTSFERRSLGSESALRHAIEQARSAGSQQALAAQLTYQLYFLTGQAALSNLQSNRYPDFRLETLADFFVHKLRFAK